MAAPTWLFDLDNTLHDASPHIFPHLHRSMREYIERYLGVDTAEATRIREAYWSRYGATLLGLVRHHGTDPRHFLHHTHQFADLPRMVVYDRAVGAMLRKLPGRKIVFSNAPLAYTEAVLAIAGIRRQFDAVWTIERLRFQPKPQLAGFLRLLRRERLNPKSCVMVEDSAPNLFTAKRLGMKTVLVSRSPRVPAHVDLRLQSVLDLPRHLARL
ncbi:MAG: pyrimidine 5'-nucleotidase [Rhodocyclaceae bacterium]|nr:pyrimidine 5'-nucleotidase [Rhodocyclaceae bacterium]